MDQCGENKKQHVSVDRAEFRRQASIAAGSLKHRRLTQSSLKSCAASSARTKLGRLMGVVVGIGVLLGELDGFPW